MKPKVSICIPSYGQPQRLAKAIDSCLIQEFTDFEIVVCDDTPDDSVKQTVQTFSDQRIKYFKNKISLGSPENWNETARQACGDYIKMLHHDDWLTSPNSLTQYVNLLESTPGADFAFSGSINCDEKGNPKWAHSANDKSVRQIRSQPTRLILGNFIGAPSATIYRREDLVQYDKKLKWLVDLEFYIQYIYRYRRIAFTKELLVGITTGSENQVTAESGSYTTIEVSEHIHVYEKFKAQHGIDHNIFNKLWKTFDYFKIFSETAIRNCGIDGESFSVDIRILLFMLKANKKVMVFLALLRRALTPEEWSTHTSRLLGYLLAKWMS
jgi:glycosyltransferase involved in cell wall biosynthesis